MNPGPLVIAALCILAGPALAAGPIFRCGADGRSFSQTPCAGGAPVTVADEPSAERQAEARRVAEQDRRLADEMERSRLADEAAHRPRGAAALTQPARRAGPQAQGDDEHAHKPRLYRKPTTKKKTSKGPGATVLRPAPHGR